MLHQEILNLIYADITNQYWMGCSSQTKLKQIFDKKTKIAYNNISILLSLGGWYTSFNSQPNSLSFWDQVVFDWSSSHVS